MKVNQLKTGAVLSYISMGLGNLISILYTPLMLRLLGQSEYGLYNLVASVVSYLGVLNFGLGSAYIRYYLRYKVKKDELMIAKLNGMFLIIFTIIGIVTIISGTILAFNAQFIFGDQLSSTELFKAKILMLILVANLVISFPSIVFNSHISANEQFVFQNVVQLIRIIVNPFVVLPVLILGFGSIGMVLVTTILNISMEFLNITFCLKKLEMKFNFKAFDFTLMKEMITFSSFIFVNLVIDQINWNIDKIILGRYHGTIAVAVYGLAAQLNMYYISISTTISSVFIPRVHKIVATTNSNYDLLELFTRIGRIQFIILSFVATAIVFFGDSFIMLWAGENYSKSYYILLLLVIPVTIPLIQNIGIEIQRARNLHQFRSLVYFFIAIFNLILTIPLAKMYSGIGAAFGTALSLIIGNGFIMNWYNHTKVGLDMEFFWKSILSFAPALVIPIILGLIMNNYIYIGNIFYLLITGFAYAIIYFVSMWLFGMNEYEKDLIAIPTFKLFKHIRK